jgi:hypothetical protein
MEILHFFAITLFRASCGAALGGAMVANYKILSFSLIAGIVFFAAERTLTRERRRYLGEID